MSEEPEIGSVWRHGKGKLYRVTGRAIIEATNTPAVLYQEVSRRDPDFCCGDTWVRPLSQFLDGRFVREDFA